MRLTLRTMLAYMDGILDPEDAEDIRQRIAESERATNLMHRARDVVRRLRLAAPAISTKAPGLDPNTVAEYLDNTLPGDHVADFEKVCLDSDMHLAEVASCHQVLTLVLGEPAEIAPESRQRMYEIPQSPAARRADEDQAEATRPAAMPPALPQARQGSQGRSKPAVPDYLREPRKRRRVLPIVGVGLVACGLIIVLLGALGQFDRGTLLGNLLPWQQAEPPAQPPMPVEEPAAADAGPLASAAGPEVAQPGGVAASEGPEEPGASAEPAPMPPATGNEPGAEQPAPLPGEVAVIPEPSIPPLPPGPGAEAAATSGEPGSQAVPAGPGAAEAQPMGRLITGNQVLLQYDPELAGWQRVPGKGILAPRVRLLSLPTFRPETALAAGVTLQLIGGTQVELLEPDGQEPAGLRLDFGRSVLMPVADAGTRLRLAMGDWSGVVSFAQPDSEAAVEVVPVLPPGMDPEAGPHPLEVKLYAAKGEIVWADGRGGAQVRLTAPAELDLAGPPGPAAAVTELPKWLTSDELGVLDARASMELERSLLVERPAGLGLMELADHRLEEVSWLAVRDLSYLGQFNRMVEALDNEEKKLDWPDYIDELRAAVARNPETAAAARQGLDRAYGQQGLDLYRMLWGYTDKDLAGGEDARLVDFLDNDRLAVRVLAFWNLKDITGLGLFYRPELAAAQRQMSVRRWRERLDAGEIRHRPAAAPAGLTPTAPAPPPAAAPATPPAASPTPPVAPPATAPSTVPATPDAVPSLPPAPEATPPAAATPESLPEPVAPAVDG